MTRDEWLYGVLRQAPEAWGTPAIYAPDPDYCAVTWALDDTSATLIYSGGEVSCSPSVAETDTSVLGGLRLAERMFDLLKKEGRR